MYQEIQYGRLYEQIVAQIENRILVGELNPGDKLPPEHELARQFGVSRTAVREAMKALSLKGLIIVHPGRGTFVTDSTSAAFRQSIHLLLKFGNVHGIQDLMEIREIMEPEIAALAANRASEKQIAVMQEAVAAMEEAMDDPDTFIEADLDFHLALSEATNNTLIPVLIDSLIDLLREHRRRAARVEGGLIRGQPFHKVIMNAVIHRNSKDARQAMSDHLHQVRKEIEASLSQES